MKNTLTLFLLCIAATSFSQQKISFQCDDVKTAKKHLPMVSYVDAIEGYTDTKVQSYLPELADSYLVKAQFHPFMYALHMAYKEHRPLVISPDMIWLLIAQGMGAHVNQNSQALRKLFVQHNNKKHLSLDTRKYGVFVKGKAANPWQKLTPVFADSIKEHVGAPYYATMVQEFSTTKPAIKTAYEITLMHSVKSYFTYEARTMCGIPEITLEGTPKDWHKIIQATKALRQYDTDVWVSAMLPVLEKISATAQGNIDQDFWKNIYKVGGGSGGPYITGWIIKFFPYVGETDLKPNPYLVKEPAGIMSGLTMDILPSGIATAPFVWKYNNESYDMQFAAGFVGVKQDVISLRLRPEISWYVQESDLPVVEED